MITRAENSDSIQDEGSRSDLDFPSKETLPYLINLITRLMAMHYLSSLESTGITQAQTFVLRELMIKEPQSQIDLARNLEVGKVAIGETIARLSANGLIERKRSPDDGRMFLISLTDKAWAMKPDLVVKSYKQLDMVHGIIGEKDYDYILPLLSRLAKELKVRLDTPDPENGKHASGGDR